MTTLICSLETSSFHQRMQNANKISICCEANSLVKYVTRLAVLSPVERLKGPLTGKRVLFSRDFFIPRVTLAEAQNGSTFKTIKNTFRHVPISTIDQDVFLWTACWKKVKRKPRANCPYRHNTMWAVERLRLLPGYMFVCGVWSRPKAHCKSCDRNKESN